MTSLNSKYRPRILSEVVGQPQIVDLLSNLFKTGNMPAVMACLGPSGHGKTTLARIIARLVNCKAPNGSDSCGACKNCKAIDAGAMSDIEEVNSATDRGINFVRSLERKIRFLPKHGNKRVYIFDEAHSITKQAMEAMLKMLEDHPRHVMFILCTTEPQVLPVTLLQRCKQLHFRSIEPAVIAKDLLRPIARAEGWNIPRDQLLELAEHADGIPRIAVTLLESVGAAVSAGGKKVDVEVLVQKAITSMDWKPPQRAAAHFIKAVLAGDNTAAFELTQYERADLVLRSIHDLITEALKVKLAAGGRPAMTAGLHKLRDGLLLTLQKRTLDHLTSVIGLQGGFSPSNPAELGSFVSEVIVIYAAEAASAPTAKKKT